MSHIYVYLYVRISPSLSLEIYTHDDVAWPDDTKRIQGMQIELMPCVARLGLRHHQAAALSLLLTQLQTAILQELFRLKVAAPVFAQSPPLLCESA